jgi:hypothetical protein
MLDFMEDRQKTPFAIAVEGDDLRRSVDIPGFVGLHVLDLSCLNPWRFVAATRARHQSIPPPTVRRIPAN